MDDKTIDAGTHVGAFTKKDFLQQVLLLSLAIYTGFYSSSAPGHILWDCAVPYVESFSEHVSLYLADISDGASSYFKERAEYSTTVKDLSVDEESFLDCYVYKTLSADDRALYRTIYDGIMAHETEISVNTLSEELLYNMYRAVIADHGEIFWTDGCSVREYERRGKLIELTLLPSYTKDSEISAYFKDVVAGKVDEILMSAPFTGTDYEKLLFVYDYMVKNVSYSRAADENQNILSVFLYKQTLCQGYAEAMQYLLGELGIESAVITGYLGNVPHAWNLVRLDGEYYYCDLSLGTQKLGERTIPHYAYFAVNDEACRLRHTADVAFLLPECSSTSHNYYIKEGLYFDTMDRSEMARVIKGAYDRGDDYITVQFATKEICDEAKRIMLDEGDITEYCDGIKDVYYVQDSDFYILTIDF